LKSDFADFEQMSLASLVKTDIIFRKMSSATSTKPGDRVKTVVDPEGTEGHFVHWEKTGIACDRVRLLAKNCVKFSECVQVQKRGAKECVEARDGTVPKKCYDFITTLGECKHSMVGEF
jgi:hypothetical protein